MAVTTKPSEAIGDGIIGHDARWAALARAFDRDKVPQTLLFSGPRGVGKTTLARRFAQLLLCKAPVRDEADLPAPCGTCAACHQVSIGSYPDLRVFRPTLASADDSPAPEGLDKSNIYLPQARELRREAGYRPTAGPRKVIFVYEADKLREDAQNALLKTLEEPIAGLTLLLLAESPQRLMSTVRSRCCELPFPLVPEAVIRAWLSGRDDSPSVLEAAARVAQGRPGAALREIDRLHASLERGETVTARSEQADQLLHRIETAAPFGGLALAEAAQTLGESWSDDVLDTSHLDAKTLKTIGNNLKRAGIIAVLDELRAAYRARWRERVNAGGDGHAFARGLDLIGQTRHYISGNASPSLALDVLFSRLIALHAPGRSESRIVSTRR